MAGMERKHYQTLSASVSDSEMVSCLRRHLGTTDHGKKIPSCSPNLSILGHDGDGQACCDEDEYGLEAVGNHLALLDIRLWYPHLVLDIFCAPFLRSYGCVAGAVAVVASVVDKGRGERADRKTVNNTIELAGQPCGGGIRGYGVREARRWDRESL